MDAADWICGPAAIIVASIMKIFSMAEPASFGRKTREDLVKSQTNRKSCERCDAVTICFYRHLTSVNHMKALTIVPGKVNSASVQDVPEPPLSDGSVLVRALALGICGTDFELISADYGWPPPGSDHLILGHESLGRVEEAPENSGFEKGDLVVGIVRHPDP